MADFVNLESSGLIYTFNELRDQLCGDAKFGFDVNNIYLFGIVLCARNPNKIGLPEQWISKALPLIGTQNNGKIAVNRY